MVINPHGWEPPMPIFHVHRWVFFGKWSNEPGLQVDYLWICEYCQEASRERAPALTGCESTVGDN